MKLLKLGFGRSERATELRALWMRLSEGPDRRQLEELWPEMHGMWTAEFGEANPSPAVVEMERITDRVKRPDDPNTVHKEALARINRRMKEKVAVTDNRKEL